MLKARDLFETIKNLSVKSNGVAFNNFFVQNSDDS